MHHPFDLCDQIIHFDRLRMRAQFFPDVSDCSHDPHLEKWHRLPLDGSSARKFKESKKLPALLKKFLTKKKMA